MVFHPYFMDYLKPGAYEEKKWIVASLYTKDDLEYGLKRSNFNPITINSVDLFSKENWVELHIHRADWNDENAMAVSPNNAGVLIDLSCPIVSFYSVAWEINEENRSFSVLLTYHCIIDDLSIPNQLFNKNLNFYEFWSSVNYSKLTPSKSTLMDNFVRNSGILSKSKHSNFTVYISSYPFYFILLLLKSEPILMSLIPFLCYIKNKG